jgi:fluoride exporter
MPVTLWIALGGALGSVARYWLGLAALPISRSLPWGTVLINVGGSVIIGMFGTLTLAHGRHPLPETARLCVMVGFCGGFTTFSSFSLQTLDLLRTGAPARALANATLSVLLCVGAVAAGHYAAAVLNGGAQQVAQTEVEEAS